MCGINGIIPSDKNQIEAMNQLIAHRGPDAQGTYSDDFVSLGHTRLSIIDLSALANQPMHSSCGNYTIIYNGELYNTPELKSKLTHKYTFKSKSDTEALLYAYIEWGEDCVHKINGIFSFCIYNRKEKSLFLARDQHGIKPLYYYKTENTFCFSSEYKAISQTQNLNVMDPEAISYYLIYGFIPHPHSGIQNIKKFPHGHYATYKNKQLTLTSFTNQNLKEIQKNPPSYQQAKSDLKSIFTQVISDQLVSDRPIGITLSGGLDSNIILANAVKVNQNINTYSSSFDIGNKETNERFNMDCTLAKLSAKHFGVKHHDIKISNQEFADNLETIAWHLDEPNINPTALTSYLLYSKIKGDVDVTLSGLGGDEIFCGYPRFQIAKKAHYYKKLPNVIKSCLELVSPNLKKIHNFKTMYDIYNWQWRQSPESLQKSVHKNYWSLSHNLSPYHHYLDNAPSNPVTSSMFADRNLWMIEDSVLHADKMSMATGLEVRVPFLDKRIVNYADQLPPSYHTNFNMSVQKKLLRDIYADTLIPEILSAPKRGWQSPGSMWLRTEPVKSLCESAFAGEYFQPNEPIFNWDHLTDLHKRHIDYEYHYYHLWKVLMLIFWMKVHDIKISS